MKKYYLIHIHIKPIIGIGGWKDIYDTPGAPRGWKITVVLLCFRIEYVKMEFDNRIKTGVRALENEISSN